MSYVILRFPEVRKKVSLGKTALYALMREGKFPKPIQLSKRAKGWIEADIDRWIEERIADSQEVA